MILTAEQREDIEYIRDRVLAKFPLLGVTMSKLKTYADDGCDTAYTTGNKIVYSPKFFETLSDEEKIFVYAHEVFHVAFEHIWRCKGKDMDLWNIATDAVINQILEKEGLPIKEGLVNIPEAEGHSAEEMYVKLWNQRQERRREWQEKMQEMLDKRKEENKNSQSEDMPSPQKTDNLEQENKKDPEIPQSEHPENNSSSAEKQSQEQSNTPEIPQSEQPDDNSSSAEKQSQEQSNTMDEKEELPQMPEFPEFEFNLPNHDIWKEVVKQGSHEPYRYTTGTVQDAEKEFSKENTREKVRQAMQYSEELDEEEKKARRMDSGRSITMAGTELDGPARVKVDWKKMLKKSINVEDDGWSYRRSGIENDFSARVEEFEHENRAVTEVMLDVSGSVDLDLLKEFLRQLKPMLKDSELRVGCFDEYVYDKQEIKSAKDIDNFQITSESGWTENWDLAVRSFSKQRNINKIIFTDGMPCPGTMPKDDLKGTNVIWIVYGNEDFHPCCGKVIFANQEAIINEGKTRSFALKKTGRDI